MKTNDAGVALIKRYEGLCLNSYLCPSGVWTIGYGHTGPDVKRGQSVTKAQAEELLRKDLARCEEDVRLLLEERPVTENQFSALVSFTYNCGSDIDEDSKAEGLGDSTLLKKLLRGDVIGASMEFEKWVRGGGKILPGLVARRAAERDLFLAGWEPDPELTFTEDELS